MEQQDFLQNMLGQIEQENMFDGWVWWWIGLNDLEVADQFVWPYNGAANYTWWDVEYGEPYPGKLKRPSFAGKQMTFKVIFSFGTCKAHS